MTPPLFSLFNAQPTVPPQGGNRPLRRGQTKTPAPRLRGAFFDASRILFSPAGYTGTVGGDTMAYVDPAIRPQFDSMPPHLREHILRMGVRLETMSDLMGCLERIIVEQSDKP